MSERLPWYIHTLRNIYAAGVTTNVGSRWVQAVGEPYTAGRLLAAWWVLTGRAYALRWPRPGELEAALRPRLPDPPDLHSMKPEDRKDG